MSTKSCPKPYAPSFQGHDCTFAEEKIPRWAYHGVLKSSNIPPLESLMRAQRRRSCQTLREVAYAQTHPPDPTFVDRVSPEPTRRSREVFAASGEGSDHHLQ